MEAIHLAVMSQRPTLLVESVIVACEPLSQAFAPYTGPLYAPILAVTFAFFAPFFLLGYIVFGAMGERGFGRLEMTGCIPSFVHGSITFVTCALQVYQHLMTHGGALDSDNTQSQVAVLQFSSGYFVSDVLLYLLPFARHEYLFLLHHAAVLSYMAIALNLGYGGISAIAMIAIGEVTSPLQNIWFILKNLRYKRKWADDLFAHVSWHYAVFYVFVRSAIGPSVIVASAYSLFMSKRLPTAAKYYWLFCLFGVLLGSQIWSKSVARRLFSKYRPQYGRDKKAS